MTKRTYIINGQKFTTVNGAIGARRLYNRRNPNDKLKSASDAKQFVEVEK